ncbi:MAG: hypothetical protein ACO4AY_06240 [Ilumatobacteraceae bacterium]
MSSVHEMSEASTSVSCSVCSVRLLERVPGSPRRAGRRDGLLVVRAITSSVRHHPVMSFGTAAAVVGVGMIAAVRQRRDADLALLAGTDG